jgi:hypothetical protein
MNKKKHGAYLIIFFMLIALVSTHAFSGSRKKEKMGKETPAAETKSMKGVAEDGPVILTEDNRSERLRSLTHNWKTNWNRRTIEYYELLHGGPRRDGIPSIDDPKFVSPQEASEWLKDNEPVIYFEHDGDARIYPLQILIFHEIVNDVVGDLPVLITFCPLCNSAIVFDRRLDGEVYEFGTSGLLRNSDLVMYDRTTESLWQQLTGEAIVGDLTGEKLRFLPGTIVSFQSFREKAPGGKVLSRDTGFGRNYGSNPYVGYDSIDQSPFLFTGNLDGRLKPMERVVAVTLEGPNAETIDVAYPYSTLSEEGVINDTISGVSVVVFHEPGTSSAVNAASVAGGQDTGSTGVFNPYVNERKLTFKRRGKKTVDTRTGSHWNIYGQAVKGPLEGTQLESIVHADHFWFAWAAFKPDTIVYK